MAARVAEVEFHRYLGLSIDRVEAGSATLTVPPGTAAANNVGLLHGGILYALLDVVVYLAAMPLLDPTTNAVTHDVHCSVLRPGKAADGVRFEGRVLRAGRSLIFGESEAFCADRLVARATVTKSVVPMPR